MGVEQSVAVVRAAVIKMMGGKSYLRPSGLVESLAQETGESRISVLQALARLSREKWIAGIAANGEPFAAVKITGEVPPPPPNPDMDRWRATLERANLEDSDVAALIPMYKALACFDEVTQREIVDGLSCLRASASKEEGKHRFVVSARYLLGSSKLLDTMPSASLKAFGIQVDRFPRHPLYVVVAGCANPETVILVENPAAFEMAVETGAARRCAFIATFGFGLSKTESEYGKQLAGMVEKRFDRAITLTREGSSCPTAKELLNHPNITFWGDLDIAGIEIYRRLNRVIPGLHLSALYGPMLDACEAAGLRHPYVASVGKEGQGLMSHPVFEDDAVAELLLSRCLHRGVDQECVPPEKIEQLAPLKMSLDF